MLRLITLAVVFVSVCKIRQVNMSYGKRSWLHLQVISGQQLPKPKASGAKGNTVDPYVTVEVFGIPADCAEERTKTVSNTGMIHRLFILFLIILTVGFI